MSGKVIEREELVRSIEFFIDWDCVEDQIAAIEEKGVKITVVEEPK